jgi:hypothetical protein
VAKRNAGKRARFIGDEPWRASLRLTQTAPASVRPSRARGTRLTARARTGTWPRTRNPVWIVSRRVDCKDDADTTYDYRFEEADASPKPNWAKCRTRRQRWLKSWPAKGNSHADRAGPRAGPWAECPRYRSHAPLHQLHVGTHDVHRSHQHQGLRQQELGRGRGLRFASCGLTQWAQGHDCTRLRTAA